MWIAARARARVRSHRRRFVSIDLVVITQRNRDFSNRTWVARAAHYLAHFDRGTISCECN
jgi:hypothetical protein